MKRREILEKRLQRLNDKITKIEERVAESTDASEVKSFQEQLEDIRSEIDETTAEIEAIDEEAKEEAKAEETEERSAVPADAKLVNGNVVGSFTSAEHVEEERKKDMDSMEYREAFMAYVQKGTPIPAELRDNQVITTTETGAAIPQTIIDEVINTVRGKYGNLYSKVRKLAVKGGIDFPIGSLSATFSWIGETSVSDRKKVNALAKVSFSYYTAEIRIAQSFLSSIVTLSSFESRIAEVIVRAYLQAMDKGIMIGTGDGQMTGVLVDERVTNTVTMTASDFANWKKWNEKLFATLPLGYQKGEFVFPLATVDKYLANMSDNNNNPIFSQAAGLDVNAEDANGRFFGRSISLVEPDIIKDFDTAQAGEVVGLFWQPEEYAINENFGFTMRRYFDEETNEWVDKAIVVVDGKTLNPTGFVKILKG